MKPLLLRLYVGCCLCLITSLMPIQAEQQPLNILWLVVEDMSPIIAPYGDATVATPNISSLADEGIVFTNAYSTSGVCAPSRAALAMGMYPTSFGANHMRTGSNTKETGLPKYEAIPPSDAKILSHHMQEAGYYTTNNYKTDYQFKPPKGIWHENSLSAHWRNRPDDTPFYSVFNFTTTHESGLFEPYGIREIESRYYFAGDREKTAELPQHHSVKTASDKTPMHISKELDFPIPPYLPNTLAVRRDLWKMYNNLVETDKQIGAVLQQLKDDGLYDETIIVFYADHGGPLPRQKRLIYDSGLKVPLIIRFPNAKHAGKRDDRLISFVDFAPTTLAMASQLVPDNMHGTPFAHASGLPKDESRDYVFAAADRFDGFTDTIRAVKDKRFKYIRNYRPEQGYYLPVAYRERIPTMQSLLALHKQDKLNEAQAQWFRQDKLKEELFDTVNDPHELHNLAADPKYALDLKRFRAVLAQWLKRTGDVPEMAEANLIKQLWNGAETQPVTEPPVVKFDSGVTTISTPTEGAIIAYQINQHSEWQLYQEPLQSKSGTQLTVIAHRLGFKPSAPIISTFK